MLWRRGCGRKATTLNRIAYYGAVATRLWTEGHNPKLFLDVRRLLWESISNSHVTQAPLRFLGPPGGPFSRSGRAPGPHLQEFRQDIGTSVGHPTAEVDDPAMLAGDVLPGGGAQGENAGR